MSDFKAVEVNFQGVPGYMVSQYVNGEQVVEQFVSKDCYELFCNSIGMVPEIAEEKRLAKIDEEWRNEKEAYYKTITDNDPIFEISLSELIERKTSNVV